MRQRNVNIISAALALGIVGGTIAGCAMLTAPNQELASCATPGQAAPCEVPAHADLPAYTLNADLTVEGLTAPEQEARLAQIGRSTLPACTTEDSTTDCYWDAVTAGNGQGRSFVVIDGAVLYTTES